MGTFNAMEWFISVFNIVIAVALPVLLIFVIVQAIRSGRSIRSLTEETAALRAQQEELRQRLDASEK